MSPVTNANTSPPADSSGATLVSPPPIRRSAKDKTRQKAIKHTLQAIPDNIVFGMPAREFIDSFLPVDTTCTTRNNRKFIGKIVCAGTRSTEGPTSHERDMFGFLIDAMSELLNEFTIVNTSRNQQVNPTSDVEWTPDLIAYRNSEDGESTFAVTDFSKADICHDIMEHDFICDLGLDATEQERQISCPIKPCRKAVRELRRLLLGLAELCNRQHRTHLFHVMLTPSSARLLRRDRSGIIISAAIPINKDSSLIEEFYLRYNHASDAMRGHDTTIRHATKEEIAVASPYLKDCAPKRGIAHDFHVFDVPLPNDYPSSSFNATGIRRVIAWAPMSELNKDTSRATRAYAAFDPKSKEVFFLKDSWRTDTEQFAKESDILRELNAKNVEHVPTLFAGDDVPGLYQRTATQEYLDASWRTGPRYIVPPRVHHRLLAEFLPENILTFRTPRSMLQCVRHALIAHQQAYERCGILHRDISTNNLLIRNGEEGILGDWDHGLRVGDPDQNDPHEAHIFDDIHRRVGTMSFMSTGLARFPSKRNTLQDDLESMVWVVFCACVLFLPWTTTKPLDIGHLYNSLFNDEDLLSENGRGGSAKRLVLMGSFGTQGLEWSGNRPLTEWTRGAFCLFNSLHCYHESRFALKETADALAKFNLTPSLAAFPTQLSDHNFMISMTAAALAMDGWAENKGPSALHIAQGPFIFRPSSSSPSNGQCIEEVHGGSRNFESAKIPDQDCSSRKGPTSVDDVPAPRRSIRNKTTTTPAEPHIPRSSSSKRQRQADETPAKPRKRAKSLAEAPVEGSDTGRRITRSMTREREKSTEGRKTRSRTLQVEATRSLDRGIARRKRRA